MHILTTTTFNLTYFALSQRGVLLRLPYTPTQNLVRQRALSQEPTTCCDDGQKADI